MLSTMSFSSPVGASLPLPRFNMSGACFTPPELLLGSFADQHSSVHDAEKAVTWRAGLTLHFMLFGYHPFEVDPSAVFSILHECRLTNLDALSETCIVVNRHMSMLEGK